MSDIRQQCRHERDQKYWGMPAVCRRLKKEENHKQWLILRVQKKKMRLYTNYSVSSFPLLGTEGVDSERGTHFWHLHHAHQQKLQWSPNCWRNAWARHLGNFLGTYSSHHGRDFQWWNAYRLWSYLSSFHPSSNPGSNPSLDSREYCEPWNW